MEAEGEEKVKNLFAEGFAIMGFNITDDEIDSDDKKEEQNKKERNKLEEKANNTGNGGMSMEIDTVGNKNGEEKRIPIGGDLYNSDASSEEFLVNYSSNPQEITKNHFKTNFTHFSQNTFNPRCPDVVGS